MIKKNCKYRQVKLAKQQAIGRKTYPPIGFSAHFYQAINREIGFRTLKHLSRGQYSDFVSSVCFEFLGCAALVYGYFKKTVASD